MKEIQAIAVIILVNNHLVLVDLASLADSLSQVLESGNGRIPVDAGIGDGHALPEAGWTLGWDLLVALIDVGLDHDTDDRLLAGAELVADSLGDGWLVSVVLVGVSCG